MADEMRALLTENEREILSGAKSVDTNYQYSIDSRIRTRINRTFVDDLQLLKQHRPEMFSALVDAVESVESGTLEVEE